MAATKFYVWVTLFSDSAADRLTTGLIRRGLQVGPLSASKNLTISRQCSTLCALQIEGDVPALDKGSGPQHWMMNHVRDTLQKNQDSCLSLVVHEMGMSFTWDGMIVNSPEGKLPPPKSPEPTAMDKIDEALKEDP